MYVFEMLESAGVAIARMTDKADPQPALPENLAPIKLAKQVHGTRIVDAAGVTSTVEADGIVTCDPGVAIGVNIADCVPILLADVDAPCVAVVHAGRRGLETGIAAEAVRAMLNLGAQPERIRAAIGPSAGPCCYEVSPDMAGAWRAQGWPADGRMLDLWETAAMQLRAAGIPKAQIFTSGVCTICNDRFYSYRRGDETPRNIAYLVL
jgi:hypothetical protein